MSDTRSGSEAPGLLGEALLTDLYQLTMAHAHWREGRHEREAVFHLSFRRAPAGEPFAVAAGLGLVPAILDARFSAGDLAYLAGLAGHDGRPLFDPGFLSLLEGAGPVGRGLRVDAVPEGRVVFAHQPLLTVRGPIWRAQLVETALLATVNFSTLVATAAARLVRAARGKPVLELGLRRAQGPDGGLMASRAAWIGGVAGTSNVLAGRRAGVPVRGTLAHAWIMSFDDELEAFLAYARAMPNNVTLLVDTYDTLRGVDRAIEVGRALRARGYDLAGVRLDSGDLAALSREARRRLDAAGFASTRVVASNDLDADAVAALEAAGAPIDVYGVGTWLVTGGGQAALGGVYKLAAFAGEDGALAPKVKRSEDPAKCSLPGLLGVWRTHGPRGAPAGDVIFERGAPPVAPGEALLAPFAVDGRPVAPVEPLEAARARAAADLALFEPVARGAPYPVTLAPALAARREALIAAARQEVTR